MEGYRKLGNLTILESRYRDHCPVGQLLVFLDVYSVEVLYYSWLAGYSLKTQSRPVSKRGGIICEQSATITPKQRLSRADSPEELRGEKGRGPVHGQLEEKPSTKILRDPIGQPGHFLFSLGFRDGWVQKGKF